MSLSNWKARYRVDNVPLVWLPLYWIYGYGFGLLMRGYYRLIHATCRFEVTGREKIEPQGNYIFSLWHSNLVVFFSSFLDNRNQTWLTHPLWYMKPPIVAMELSGIRCLLGSTGYAGREASDALVAELKSGRSTVICPDGPYGPFRQLRKGVLHLSQQSGLPVVPLAFEVSRFLEAPQEDRKKYVLPFSTIKIRYGDPIVVTSANFIEATDYLTRAMDY